MTNIASLACSHWPRLYLDTAEILSIADGKSDPVTVQELLHEMRARGVILVVSVEHLQDAIPRASEGTAGKVSTALERFLFRAVVTQRPDQVEPWPDAQRPGDIGLAMASNIREFVTADAAAPVLHSHGSVQSMLHEMATLQHELQAMISDRPVLSRVEVEVLIGCLVTLIKGWRGYDVTELIPYWEHQLGISLPSQARLEMLLRLAPFSILMLEVDMLLHPSEEQRAQLLSGFRDAFDPESHAKSPGTYLARCVTGSRARNISRVPTYSDSVDAVHVSHFPYVDIATCDRQTFACIAPHLSRATRPRAATVIKNGHLTEVVKAVRALPLFPQLEQ